MLIKTLFETISKPIPQQAPVHSSWFYDEVDDNLEHWSKVTRIRMMAILLLVTMLLDTYGDDRGEIGGHNNHKLDVVTNSFEC